MEGLWAGRRADRLVCVWRGDKSFDLPQLALLCYVLLKKLKPSCGDAVLFPQIYCVDSQPLPFSIPVGAVAQLGHL